MTRIALMIRATRFRGVYINMLLNCTGLAKVETFHFFMSGEKEDLGKQGVMASDEPWPYHTGF